MAHVSRPVQLRTEGQQRGVEAKMSVLSIYRM